MTEYSNAHETTYDFGNRSVHSAERARVLSAGGSLVNTLVVSVERIPLATERRPTRAHAVHKDCNMTYEETVWKQAPRGRKITLASSRLAVQPVVVRSIDERAT